MLPEHAPFSSDQRQALDSLLASLDPVQRGWLSGFLAAPGSPAAPMPVAAGKLMVLYGTESGNSEVLADRTVRCWGANSNGQVGDGSTINRRVATAVPNLAGVAQIALGGNASCARLTDGSVRCWGSNAAGQLGVGDAAVTQQLAPTAVTW